MSKIDKKNIAKLLNSDINTNNNLSLIEKEIFNLNSLIQNHKNNIEKLQNKLEIEKLKKENYENLKLMLQSKLNQSKLNSTKKADK